MNGCKRTLAEASFPDQILRERNVCNVNEQIQQNSCGALHSKLRLSVIA